VTVLQQRVGPTHALLPLDRLSTVTLGDVDARAALMSRVDRKYLVPVDVGADLLDRLGATHGVLQIAGRRSTTYRSTYFDSADLASTRAHVQGRRRRWKVRQRWYVEDDLCRTEVKTKDGRGRTIKTAAPTSVDRYGTLGPEEQAFVRSVLLGVHPSLGAPDLVPSAEISYARATLADLAAGERVTVDWGLVSSWGAGQVVLDDAHLLIETKGSLVPGRADRLLARLGAHPQSFSKYAATTSLLHPGIADNDVRRHAGRALHLRLHEGTP
jgi:hypothetical protein